MYHDYTRTKRKIKSALFSLAMIIIFAICAWYLVAFAVSCFSGHGEEASENIEVLPSESVQIITEQEQEEVEIEFSTSIPDLTTMPISLGLVPTTSEPVLLKSNTKPECTENVEPTVEPTPEPVPERENTLYYFVECDIRTDVPIEYQDYLYDLLKDYGHEDKYELIMALIYHESGWQPDSVSGSHDYGLMQINRCNHRWLRKKLGITDFLDPYQSMQAGVHMICSLFDKYDSAEKALVCYNMGEGGARGISSSRYSRGVLADMDLLVKLEC